jgi:ribosome-binding factor A
MQIFVQSRGISVDYGYNWVDKNQVIVAKPNILNNFIDLLQESSSLLIARENQKLLLVVTGIPSARRDYQNRIIFISVAWIVDDNDDKEAKIRSLASKILSPVTGEIDPKQSIEDCVKDGGKNGFTVEDFESLINLLKDQENSSASKSELKLQPELEIKSDEPIKQLEQLEQLAKDLKEQSLPKKDIPLKDIPLVVVTGIQSYADFKKANVFRGLAKFVDERGGEQKNEDSFREVKGKFREVHGGNSQGHDKGHKRSSRSSRKNERPIQQKIVVSVLAIFVCISLALGIWFYIQSNDQNPNNQQQNDNINSSNKPIQTLIMEPNAVQKELTSQEKTEELKEEKIN